MWQARATRRKVRASDVEAIASKEGWESVAGLASKTTIRTAEETSVLFLGGPPHANELETYLIVSALKPPVIFLLPNFQETSAVRIIRERYIL